MATTQQPSRGLLNQIDQHRYLLYPLVVLIVYICWLTYMSWADAWALLQEYWSVTVTMIFGSFVAGATAEGGAAVAFPIFTKVLGINSSTARTFGLMIQSIGMTTAAVVIFGNRVPILPRVILWVSLGGILGQLTGLFVNLPNPYPRILFTFVAAAFGIALIITRWFLKWTPIDDVPNWRNGHRFAFFIVGIGGGLFASFTGSGIDMVTFVLLTLAFGVNEKISTPTTVVIMGLNSVVGFFIHAFITQDIGAIYQLGAVTKTFVEIANTGASVVFDGTGTAFEYWLAAVPVVVFGAPLGAWVASRVSRDTIIYFLEFLIWLEVVTTIWLVKFPPRGLLITSLCVGVCALLFWAMLRYRKTRITPQISS